MSLRKTVDILDVLNKLGGLTGMTVSEIITAVHKDSGVLVNQRTMYRYLDLLLDVSLIEMSSVQRKESSHKGWGNEVRRFRAMARIDHIC